MTCACVPDFTRACPPHRENEHKTHTLAKHNDASSTTCKCTDDVNRPDAHLLCKGRPTARARHLAGTWRCRHQRTGWRATPNASGAVSILPCISIEYMHQSSLLGWGRVSRSHGLQQEAAAVGAGVLKPMPGRARSCAAQFSCICDCLQRFVALPAAEILAGMRVPTGPLLAVQQPPASTGRAQLRQSPAVLPLALPSR